MMVTLVLEDDDHVISVVGVFHNSREAAVVADTLQSEADSPYLSYFIQTMDVR